MEEGRVQRQADTCQLDNDTVYPGKSIDLNACLLNCPQKTSDANLF